MFDVNLAHMDRFKHALDLTLTDDPMQENEWEEFLGLMKEHSKWSNDGGTIVQIGLIFY